MDFTYNNKQLIDHLRKLPLTPTVEYGNIISMTDINVIVSLYRNEYDLLKEHLVKAEKDGLIKIYRSQVDDECFNGISII